MCDSGLDDEFGNRNIGRHLERQRWRREGWRTDRGGQLSWGLDCAERLFWEVGFGGTPDHQAQANVKLQQ